MDTPDLTEASVAALVAAGVAAFEAAATTAELKAARIAHLGDKAPLILANRAIGSLPGPERKDAGQRVGAARAELNKVCEERHQLLADAELHERLLAERVDVTEPDSYFPTVGEPHPITALMDELADVFVAMGWEIAEGPELEAEWMNFDALNMGPNHPARATSDTLFIDPIENHLVLRTHTSPVQIRAMLSCDYTGRRRELPIYVVCPGTTFRADEFDATHVPAFHQLEGLVVDKGITLGHLKGTLDHLAAVMFGEGVRTRIRPSYFPFTEPSAELDLECFVCHGASVGNPDAPCRTCNSEGWIEWGGCGVVNPRVLAAGGVDTEIYSGFAFGMGVERTLMFRNGAADMRDMVEGDIRFSQALVGGAR
ncbi:MAG: phenylalanine--tRNA ligase subunit alpha [Propionibacteriaceae bacterium]|jgi:phenylalanyl-tRNA synthetase alpha chain|nr:phenylalanine--tRNA ligase subunit alpha [Propionibacteriaceae bacterium]